MFKRILSSMLRPFRQNLNEGMTIIEILIVIALMSTIMAVLVTKLLDKSDSAKADLVGIQQGKLNESLSMYKIDTGRFPSTDDGLQALVEGPAAVKNWRGPYTEAEKLNDTWGKAFQYELVNGRQFKITSAGLDGEFGTEDDIVYPKQKEPAQEEAPVTATLKVPKGNLNEVTK